MLQYKQYRHLYTEDCYRTGLLDPSDNWNALQYVKRDASEALLYVFRNGEVRASASSASGGSTRMRSTPSPPGTSGPARNGPFPAVT